MAKKSGSRSSRSERNAGRKRAERARQHGLPVRQGPPPRARALTPEPSDDAYGEARSSDAPLSSAKKPTRIPTLVKVVGAALAILIGVYLLSRQRDEALLETKPAAEPAAAVSAVAAPATEVGPELLPSPEPRAPLPEPSPEAPAPILSVTPPVTPLVAAPAAAEPSRPKVGKTAVAAPAMPKPVAAPAAPAAVAAPAPVAAPVAPAAAPGPKPAAPQPPPADNPY